MFEEEDWKLGMSEEKIVFRRERIEGGCVEKIESEIEKGKIEEGEDEGIK